MASGSSIRSSSRSRSDENPSNLGGYANYLVGSLKVDAVYVFPDPAIEVRQLYDALGPTGARIIGTTLPTLVRVAG